MAGLDTDNLLGIAFMVEFANIKRLLNDYLVSLSINNLSLILYHSFT